METFTPGIYLRKSWYAEPGRRRPLIEGASKFMPFRTEFWTFVRGA
jgi:hypothetical protein